MNSAKFLITLSLKKTSDGCFCINTRSAYCPTYCFFQKRCHTYFPAEYFLDLIYRLVTRLSSIFQTLRQKPLNPVHHLRWRFFVKIVNSLKLFRKKAPLQMFDQVLNMHLYAATKRCSKLKN